MQCNYFESFEDIYRSSVKRDDSCEVHISDSEEELPRFPKKSNAVKKTGNADILPKTAPCDYSFAVRKWRFYKTETANLLQPSNELKKLNSREKRQYVRSMIDNTKSLEDCSNKGSLLRENRVPLNLASTSENELSVCGSVGKSTLLEIQNSLPHSINMYAKPIKKPSRFLADDDLLNGVQVTPRVKKTKPQLLKEISSDVFINSHKDFKLCQATSLEVSKNAGASDGFTSVLSLTTPKLKRVVLPQVPDAKRNASNITSKSIAECDDMGQKMSKNSDSFADCGFFDDPGVTSKNEDLQKLCSQNLVSSMHKGSDFVKSIKLHQQSVSKPKKEMDVHSEKRKKYLPGGLAEQAQKLEYREKSSIVLWSYQKNSEAGIGTGRYLSLKIHLFSVVDSFIITKCEILEDSTISVEQKDRSKLLFNFVSRSNATTTSNETEGELKTEHFFKQDKESSSDFKDCVYSNILGRGEEFKSCLLAIKLGTWKRLKLATGANIKIFPPWQTLWLSSLSVHVLLCTYFMEVLSTPPSVRKSPSEKVLYSHAASCTNAVVQDVDKKPGVFKSCSVGDSKRHSSSGILKLKEKREFGKSSVNKTKFLKKLTRDAKIGELVVVTGEIVKVNEKGSEVWLECDQCQSENLVADEQGITYCEACSKTVSEPVRKMKKEVVLWVPDMSDIVLVVQLFCPTVEKIFPMTQEGQPLYGVSDILHTSVGPVVCSVISCSVIGNKITYYLQEVGNMKYL